MCSKQHWLGIGTGPPPAGVLEHIPSCDLSLFICEGGEGFYPSHILFMSKEGPLSAELWWEGNLLKGYSAVPKIARNGKPDPKTEVHTCMFSGQTKPVGKKHYTIGHAWYVVTATPISMPWLVRWIWHLFVSYCDFRLEDSIRAGPSSPFHLLASDSKAGVCACLIDWNHMLPPADLGGLHWTFRALRRWVMSFPLTEWWEIPLIRNGFTC